VTASGPTERNEQGATPTFVVFDSGFGGLSIVRAIRERGLGGRLVYIADHAGFPYGERAAADVVDRVERITAAAVAAYDPVAFVVACNTASTLVLPTLRARWDIPIVGVAPAIKPAVAATASGRVSVLATPGTVARDYTRDLIAEFAGDTQVTLVGAANLAALCEAHVMGEPVDLEAVRAEIAPAFVTVAGARTDAVALACTHFPLALDLLEAAAPWPVSWIDPAPAIARRLEDVAPQLASSAVVEGVFCSTAPLAPGAALTAMLTELGLGAGVVAFDGP